MPKSKRNKIVHLTQVKKKGKDHKEDLMEQLKQLVKEYEFVYLFDFDKTKSDRIMELRLKMKGYGRIFAGRNSLVAQTLKTIGSETKTNYDNFLKQIVGHRGLLFTDLPRDELISTLESSLEEFLDKLLGYAQLKTPDDASAEVEDDDDGDDDATNEPMDDDDDAGASAKTKQKCVSFRPIKRARKKKKKNRTP